MYKIPCKLKNFAFMQMLCPLLYPLLGIHMRSVNIDVPSTTYSSCFATHFDCSR